MKKVDAISGNFFHDSLKFFCQCFYHIDTYNLLFYPNDTKLSITIVYIK